MKSKKMDKKEDKTEAKGKKGAAKVAAMSPDDWANEKRKAGVQSNS